MQDSNQQKIWRKDEEGNLNLTDNEYAERWRRERSESSNPHATDIIAAHQARQTAKESWEALEAKTLFNHRNTRRNTRVLEGVQDHMEKLDRRISDREGNENAFAAAHNSLAEEVYAQGKRLEALEVYLPPKHAWLKSLLFGSIVVVGFKVWLKAWQKETLDKATIDANATFRRCVSDNPEMVQAFAQDIKGEVMHLIHEEVDKLKEVPDNVAELKSRLEALDGNSKESINEARLMMASLRKATQNARLLQESLAAPLEKVQAQLTWQEEALKAVTIQANVGRRSKLDLSAVWDKLSDSDKKHVPRPADS